MPRDFKAQLKRIREASDDTDVERAAARQQELDARRAQREKYDVLRDALLAAIEEAFESFCEEFEGFQSKSGYQGGNQVLSVSYDEVAMSTGPGAHIDKYLSQLTFNVKALRKSSYFVVTAKTVLRNKEWGVRTWEDKIERAEPEQLVEFAQNEVLRFARRYSRRGTIARD